MPDTQPLYAHPGHTMTAILTYSNTLNLHWYLSAIH